MGVPDFLKFVARAAPAALCRIPKSEAADGAQDALSFDYILIDATNVAQTLGLDTVTRFLLGSSVVARRAIVFALDSGRDRSGTTRQHRQTHLIVNDLQIAVQQVCVRVQRHYDERRGRVAPPQACKSRGEPLQGVASAPLVLMSGRGVAGEADYKVLDLQRHILAAALVSSVGGAKSALPSFLLVSEDSDLLCGALCGPAPHTVSIATTLHDTMFELGVLRLSHVLGYVAACVDAFHVPDDASTAVPAVADKAHAEAEVAATDVVRRRRVDGPMVATGVRITLSDSDDDDEGAVPEASLTRIADAPFAAAAGAILQSSAVDLVFLFVLVLGNGAEVPPLLAGVTKVDIACCWQAYCERKYDAAVAPPTSLAAQRGRTLVGWARGTTRPPTSGEEHAGVTLNCEFLHAILSVMHCADAQSRAPNEEDQRRATTLLSAALYATFRYTVGCNVDSSPALRDTLLDGRALGETRLTQPPPLAAMLTLLQRGPSLTFHYPLHGVQDPSRAAVTGQGTSHPSPHAPAVATTSGAATTRRLQLDVCATLTRPAASSWAVQGGGGEASLYDVLDHDYAIPAAAHDDAGRTRKGRASVGALVRFYAAAKGEAAGSTFAALALLWRESVVRAMPQLHALVHQMGATAAADEGEGRRCSTGADRYIYSFELRRMAPVLGSTGDAAVTRTAASEHAALLQSALGLSYDYATPGPTVPAAPSTRVGKRQRVAHPRQRTTDSAPPQPSSSEDACGRTKKKQRSGKAQRLSYMKQMRKAATAAGATTTLNKSTTDAT